MMKRLPLFVSAFVLFVLATGTAAQAPVMTSWATSPTLSETRVRFRMDDRSINNGYALCEANFSMSAATCALIDEVTIFVYQDDGVGTYGTQLYSRTFSPGIGVLPVDINDRTRIQITSSGATQMVYIRMVAKGVSAPDGFELETPNVTTTIVTSDPYDPNDLYTTASVVTSGVVHSGLVINTDADYYPVTITPTNRNLIFSINYLNDYRVPESQLDLDLFLVSSSGSTLSSSTSSAVSTGGPITETIDEILDPGTYYISVRPKSVDPNRNFYELRWDTYRSPTYQISGIVRDEGNHDISGVTMNGLIGDPVTDASGYYGAVVEHGWSGTVTPTLGGYTFDPVSRTYTDVEEAHNSDAYIAMLDYPAISGRITSSVGAGEAGVTLSGFPETVVTDADGYYIGTVPYNWTGTITPIATGLEFTPSGTVYPPVRLNLTNRDYTSAVGSVTVSGTVARQGIDIPLAEVIITGSPGPVVTGSSGDYSFEVLYGSSFTLTPVLDGYSFDPINYVVTDIHTNLVVDFTGTPNPYNISGTIRDGSNMNVAPVTLLGLPGDPVTDWNGYYSVEVEHGWSGTVTPALTGYTFDPVSVDYSNVTDAQSQNYTATPNTYLIDGYVRTEGGAGIAGVMMLGLSVNPTTNSEGYYSGNVMYGFNITVIPTLDGYSFTPSSTNYSPVTGDATTDYTGTPGPYLNTSQHIILLTEEAGANDLVTVTSNVEWTVTCGESWITLAPVSGSDNGSFTITANTTNTGTARRDATVTLTGEGLTRILDVSQDGSDPFLEVSSATATLGAGLGAGQTVAITSNIAWSVSETADWLSVSPESGANEDVITISATLANDQIVSRTAMVLVTGSDISHNIEVTQAAGEARLEITAPAAPLAAEAGSNLTLNIISNIAWTVTDTSGWLSVTPASGTGDQAIAVTAETQNSGSSERISDLVVEGGGVVRNITITQSAGEGTGISILFEQTELKVYPNPAIDRLFLESNRELKSEVVVKMLDITGKVLFEQQLPYLSPGLPAAIDISEYPVGQYLLHISNNSAQQVFKFIKFR